MSEKVISYCTDEWRFLHKCVIKFLWFTRIRIKNCRSLRFQNSFPCMRYGAYMVWYLSILMMYCFSKTEAAFSILSIILADSSFPFPSLNSMYKSQNNSQDVTDFRDTQMYIKILVQLITIVQFTLNRLRLLYVCRFIPRKWNVLMMYIPRDNLFLLVNTSIYFTWYRYLGINLSDVTSICWVETRTSKIGTVKITLCRIVW